MLTVQKKADARTGLARAFGRVATVLAFGVAPIVVLATMLHVGLESSSLAVDFHYELYPQAKALLDGLNPFPGADFVPRVGGNHLWPPLATAFVAPLAVLPLGVAEILLGGLGLACFAAALYVLDVRDWRVYGAWCLWPQVAGEMRVTHLTPLLALLAAVAWRYRDRRGLAGLPLGVVIGLKFFMWPLGVWLVAIGRARAAALALAISAASILLVLPFIGLADYIRALSRLGRHFDQDAYTIFGLLAQLGVGDVPARVATLLVGVALLAATWRLRSFSLSLAASLTLAPIVWLDYFALAALPLAITRPRVSALWLLPLLTWGAPGTGIGIGDPFQIARVLGVFAILFTLAARAERRSQRSADALPDHAPRGRAGDRSPVVYEARL